jgi:hypothetical protein
MKAIIIQDHDARALLDQLKLETLPNSTPTFIEGAKPEEVDEFNQRYRAWIKKTQEEAHRRFHFVVCRWLQEQGASVVRQ